MEIGLQFIFNKKEHVCIERWGAGGGGGGEGLACKIHDLLLKGFTAGGAT